MWRFFASHRISQKVRDCEVVRRCPQDVLIRIKMTMTMVMILLLSVDGATTSVNSRGRNKMMTVEDSLREDGSFEGGVRERTETRVKT